MLGGFILTYLWLAAADPGHPQWDIGYVDVPHPAQTLKQLDKSQFKGAISGWPMDFWRACEGGQRSVLQARVDGVEAATSPHAMDPSQLPADAVAHFDMANVYGLLRHLPAGSTYEQIVRRLGVEKLVSINGQVQLVSPSRFTARAAATGTFGEHGLFAALGPAVAPAWPMQVPSGAQFVAASVQPGPMWLVAERVLAGLYPLEYSVARAQLDSIEQQGGKRWVEDVLGPQARIWSFYGRTEGPWGAVFEAADGLSARALVQQILAVVATIAPQITSQVGEHSHLPTLTIKGNGKSVVMAFLPHAVILTPTLASLDAHVTPTGHKKMPPLFATSEAWPVAYGTFDNATFLRNLSPWLPGKPQPPRSLNLGKSTWSVTQGDQGWHFTLVGK